MIVNLVIPDFISHKLTKWAILTLVSHAMPTVLSAMVQEQLIVKNVPELIIWTSQLRVHQPHRVRSP
jgi:hypothetical protein